MNRGIRIDKYQSRKHTYFKILIYVLTTPVMDRLFHVVASNLAFNLTLWITGVYRDEGDRCVFKFLHHFFQVRHLRTALRSLAFPEMQHSHCIKKAVQFDFFAILIYQRWIRCNFTRFHISECRTGEDQENE